MKIKIESTKWDNESCNFCDGSLSETGRSLIYSYNNVYSFTKQFGSGLKANICTSCLMQLTKFANENPIN